MVAGEEMTLTVDDGELTLAATDISLQPTDQLKIFDGAGLTAAARPVLYPAGITDPDLAAIATMLIAVGLAVQAV